MKEEQQRRAEAEEMVANTRDQLSGVKNALGAQVMELDQQLSRSQEQCSQLQAGKVWQ